MAPVSPPRQQHFLLAPKATFTSPDNEVYRRNSELGSPASSTGHAGSNQGNAPYYYPASGPPSSYGGSRRGTTEYGGDTPTSEPHYGTPGSTGRPAASPGRLLHPVMPSPLPASTILPLPAVRHEAIAPRQPPTIESLTSQPQHSPNGLSMHHQQHRPPPPPSHQPTQGPYQCEEPGCMAAPFPTQYLLNSHANVHSSNRPHYCPEPGCPRSKTGKGFKRKNEMIRHGLVHRSPGYVCPFCPDREHKYPRPDNLQRHVRVHHKDRNKDDPQLRDVLAQRADGPSRGRRRRL
ncbi:hypothetical protein SEUCBS140593_008422 [Sporothrix eucalyptigena]|uniref:C2H2-type domain-containing protein n=1 Tax=Sporothrix eucalyptigena TaxID=1812306 RepID=A0ABP0CLE6_9PEZI